MGYAADVQDGFTVVAKQWDLPPTIKIAWQADGSSVENGQV
tara:strand:- start:473 stop:595 length:123 start_codon:yes stop_codon:yes gene_type:complete